MEIYLPFIRQGFVACQSEEGIKAPPIGKAFHILGLDILIDANLKAWLIEINDNPSLYIYLEKDFMGGGVEKEISPVDLEVKSKVVTDAIKLSKRSANSEWPVNFRSYTRLIGLNDAEECPTLHSSTSLMNLFNELTPIRDKKHLGLTSICKLL